MAKRYEVGTAINDDYVITQVGIAVPFRVPHSIQEHDEQIELTHVRNNRVVRLSKRGIDLSIAANCITFISQKDLELFGSIITEMNTEVK